MRRLWEIGAGAVAAVVLLTGCAADEAVDQGRKAAQETATKAGESGLEKAVREAAEREGTKVDDVEVDSETGTVTLEGPEGTLVVGTDLDLPDGFPTSVPMPRREHTINSVHVKDAGFNVSALVQGVTVTQQARRTADELRRAGFTVSASSGGAESSTLTGRGHGLRLLVVVSVPMPGAVAVNYDVERA